MMLEHDAKELLRSLDLKVPEARFFRDNAGLADVATPTVVKAQVPVGGRGKVGGIRLVRSREELQDAASSILGMTIKGHQVRAIRIEHPVDYVTETYVSFTIDAAAAKVRILISPEGGIDVEDEVARAQLLSAEAELDQQAVADAAYALCSFLPEAIRRPVRAATQALSEAFFDLEAIMLEINPLFVTSGGEWVIGDAKLVPDDNAFERRPAVQHRIVSQPDLYPEASLKLAHGFDFVTLNPNGHVGLVTTGAGLSMQLVDELTVRGAEPFNFCDIRTGMFRGDPSRLIQVLEWILSGPDVDVVMINFFAGATDLAETTSLLLTALDKVKIQIPVVARLIGNNLDAALRIIADAGNPIECETDLDRAIDHVVRIVEGKR